MKARLAALFFIVACKSISAPAGPPAGAGEECAIAGRATHPCRSGLTCKEAAYTPPPVVPGETRGPDKPSALGGACGGVAGFHCADGLACDMPPEQANAADGMGSCARMSTCQ